MWSFLDFETGHQIYCRRRGFEAYAWNGLADAEGIDVVGKGSDERAGVVLKIIWFRVPFGSVSMTITMIMWPKLSA